MAKAWEQNRNECLARSINDSVPVHASSKGAYRHPRAHAIPRVRETVRDRMGVKEKY